MQDYFSQVNNNINVVNDNLMTLYQKVSEIRSVDTTPILTGLTSIAQILSNQIAEVKSSVDANTSALNQVLEIVKTIPGVTVPEIQTPLQTAKSKKQ